MTTNSLVLAATWPPHQRCLAVEADPSGGVTGARYGLAATAGTVVFDGCRPPSSQPRDWVVLWFVVGWWWGGVCI